MSHRDMGVLACVWRFPARIRRLNHLTRREYPQVPQPMVLISREWGQRCLTIGVTDRCPPLEEPGNTCGQEHAYMVKTDITSQPEDMDFTTELLISLQASSSMPAPYIITGLPIPRPGQQAWSISAFDGLSKKCYASPQPLEAPLSVAWPYLQANIHSTLWWTSSELSRVIGVSAPD
jgi:hypothetical protein